MNDGYTALVVAWLFVLFWLMGLFESWKKATGLNDRKLMLIALVYLLGFAWNVSLGEKVVVLLSGYLLPLALAAVVFVKLDEKRKIGVFAQTLLVAASVALLRELFVIDPVLVITDRLYMIALLAWLLSVNLLQRPGAYFVVTTLGLGLQELWYQLQLLTFLPQVRLGEAFFSDMLWTTYLLGWGGHKLLSLQKAGLDMVKRRMVKRKMLLWKNIR